MTSGTFVTDGPTLCLHQGSVPQCSTLELLHLSARHGVSNVGLLSPLNQATDLEETQRLCSDLGIRVWSYSACGFFVSGTDPDGNPWTSADDLRVLDEAERLGARMVVVVAGPMADPMVPSAHRERMRRSLTELARLAEDRGLLLALEPAHPMFFPERAALCSLAEAASLIEEVGSSNLGLDLDLYHVWWEPGLRDVVQQIGSRLFTVQVSDWIVPIPDKLYGRGVLGDGVLPAHELVSAVRQEGYAGPIEYEVLNRDLHALAAPEAVGRLVASFRAAFGEQ